MSELGAEGARRMDVNTDAEQKMMQEAAEINENLTIGIVANGSPYAIGKLKRFLSTSDLSVIYKRIGYVHLYIVDEKQRNHD